MAGEARSRVPAVSRRTRALGWFFAGLCTLLGAALRVDAALGDPNFDVSSPKGMLKSDPGLLYYLTERIVEARGGMPADFRADPRIEHPATTDVPATFPVGQEFVVAWGYLLLGRGMPLHVFCVWIMGMWASLATLCVYGLAREIAPRVEWAALAAALYSVMPANYRTVGWILMSEDFSVPWFALHLWLLARAARVRTPAAILCASLALGIAVSTWHAMSFFAALEGACLFGWFLRTGRNPMGARASWILPATLLGFSVLVPVLRSTLFVLSLPMQIVLALWAASFRRSRGARAVACLALLLAGSIALWASRRFGGGMGEYAHVFALLEGKVRHLGALPRDPAALPIEARLMWQGPFATLDPVALFGLLGVGLVALVPAARVFGRSLRRGRADVQDEAGTLAAGLACLSILVAWLVERTILLPGLILPAVAASGIGRAVLAASTRRLVVAIAFAVLLAQAWFCFDRIERTPIAWYLPASRREEIAELVTRIPEFVPDGEAIAADFMTSTAILAHTRHPIVFQPKWESSRSRSRIVELFETFYHRAPEDLRRLLLDEYQCRFLVVDRAFFGVQRASWYAAGLEAGNPPPGSCADRFLGQDAAALAGIPGFRLLYRSPDRIRTSTGGPSDFYRVYEVSPYHQAPVKD